MDKELRNQIIASMFLPENMDAQDINSILSGDRLKAINSLPEQEKNAVISRLYASYPEQKELINESLSEANRLLEQPALDGRQTGGVYVANNILEHANRGFDKAVGLRQRNKAREDLKDLGDQKAQSRMDMYKADQPPASENSSSGTNNTPEFRFYNAGKGEINNEIPGTIADPVLGLGNGRGVQTGAEVVNALRKVGTGLGFGEPDKSNTKGFYEKQGYNALYGNDPRIAALRGKEKEKEEEEFIFYNTDPQTGRGY